MNLKNINKEYTLGFVLIALIALIIVTIVQPGTISYKDDTNYEQLQAKARYENEQYKNLLASYDVDLESGKKYMETIVNEDLVKELVYSELKPQRKIALPEIKDSEINISARQDKDAILNYFSKLSSMVDNYAAKSQPGLDEMFDTKASSDVLNYSKDATMEFLNNLKGLETPREVVPMHKSMVMAFANFSDLYDSSITYAYDSSVSPWPDLYENAYIIEKSMAMAQSENFKLTQKYSLETFVPAASTSLVFKSAQAQFAVIDVLQKAWGIFKAALAKSFAKFFVKMIDKLVQKIDKTFAIASQLYYSNALGRYYSEEFMKKFVEDPLDKKIIAQFLPEYFCIPKNKEELQQIFVAKAKLNAAPNLVFDPSDPDFLRKMTDLLTDPKNNVSYYEDYYQSLSGKVKTESSTSATKEVTSPGYKTGRDIIGGQIEVQMNKILGVQEAALQNTMALGTSNVENVAGQIVGGLMIQMVNKFVFAGLEGGGNVSVIKEQKVCLKTPVFVPVVPQPGDSPEDVPPANEPTLAPGSSFR